MSENEGYFSTADDYLSRAAEPCCRLGRADTGSVPGPAHAAGVILWHGAGNRLRTVGRLLRLLVLGGDALQGHDKVLQGALLLAALGRLAVHEVVEPDAVLQHVVETTHDAEDAEREDPDAHNSDDGRLLLALEPAEDGEERGEDVDDQHSTGQLPRGERGPEGTVGTAYTN